MSGGSAHRVAVLCCVRVGRHLARMCPDVGTVSGPRKLASHLDPGVASPKLRPKDDQQRQPRVLVRLGGCVQTAGERRQSADRHSFETGPKNLPRSVGHKASRACAQRARRSRHRRRIVRASTPPSVRASNVSELPSVRRLSLDRQRAPRRAAHQHQHRRQRCIDQ
ncbi:hypothetical protein HETIRDRAFT_435411 [Heterobasidion irregulare TC 32-1]|uniref:Uncharacterized protein n=1 Tax=Heterobasidion irregulare (strain TC 32-1) TaxID=747525 RepID=W4JZ97_HETIT|nr:uncharacterized protein HETIRDRAFT_435411 [Heterobasidion irregulare TC 32-1]ETW78774.1 hypothetical protein HETIRDRAFT_435411 [Heterobasidion irregulare TC 32-1]